MNGGGKRGNTGEPKTKTKEVRATELQTSLMKDKYTLDRLADEAMAEFGENFRTLNRIITTTLASKRPFTEALSLMTATDLGALVQAFSRSAKNTDVRFDYLTEVILAKTFAAITKMTTCIAALRQMASDIGQLIMLSEHCALSGRMNWEAMLEQIAEAKDDAVKREHRRVGVPCVLAAPPADAAMAG